MKREKNKKQKFRRLYKTLIFTSIVGVIYLGSYFILRYSLVRGKQEFDNTKGKYFIYGSLFDANNAFTKALAYVYLPLGWLDYTITGHQYWLAEDTYNYYPLNSAPIKAYIADKNKQNDAAYFDIKFNDNTKSSGFLGYLQRRPLIKSMIAEKLNLKGKSGVCIIKIKSLTRNGEVTTTHEFGFKNGIVDGQYTTSFQDQKISMTTYKNGLRDGEVICYANNGGEIINGHFKKDKHDGQWVFWYLSEGHICCKANFKNGKLNGLLEIFAPKGKVLISGIYKDNIPYNGTFIKNIHQFIFKISFIVLSRLNVEVLEYKSGKFISSKKTELISI